MTAKRILRTDKAKEPQQAGLRFDGPEGLVAFCRILRARHVSYFLVGDNNVVLRGTDLVQLKKGGAKRVLKRFSHTEHSVVPTTVSPDDKAAAARQRLLPAERVLQNIQEALDARKKK